MTDVYKRQAYDRVYELKGIEYTGDYYSLMNNMGKYIQGKYEKTNPGSVIDILCAYYKLAGYSDSQIADAIKQFVAQTYYSYCPVSYTHLSAGFMEIVSDFLTFIYRHEAMFFYIRKFYVF